MTATQHSVLHTQWHVYEAKAAERASQLAEQRVSAAELLQASEARFAASPPRPAQHSATDRSADLSRILRSGQRIAQAADVLGVKHPRDTRDHDTSAEVMMDGSSWSRAEPRTSWTVTAQHVSTVLAAGKRVVPDRPSLNGSGSPAETQPLRKSVTDHGADSGNTARQSSDRQSRDRRSPPSAESVRPPLLETQPGGRQRRESPISVAGKAPQLKATVRAAVQAEVQQSPAQRPIAAAGARDAGRRSTGDRPAGMRDAGLPSGIGGGGASSYAGQHAAREVAAAAAARAELDAVTAELEAARGQLAEALRATQAERTRAQLEREAAAEDMEHERTDERDRLKVCIRNSNTEQDCRYYCRLWRLHLQRITA